MAFNPVVSLLQAVTTQSQQLRSSDPAAVPTSTAALILKDQKDAQQSENKGQNLDIYV